MKLLIFNGSPRQGNTVEALKALREGLADYPEIEIQEIKAADCNIVPCTGCEACGRSGDCIFEDDSQEINRAVIDLIRNCPCTDGCPGCVGAAGENGTAGKAEALAICQGIGGEPHE